VNQILYTGEERVEKSVNKQKKVLPINVIVVLFSITIIVLGICLVAGSIYSKQKINETVQANIRPEIQVERNDDDNTIAIKVTHIRGIKTVTYRWNDEEETRLDGKNRKSVSQIIDLIGGENTLKISVVEENGQIRTFEKTFIAGNIPEITLEGVANGVKIIATSEEGIAYVQYGWDDGEMQKIEVGEKRYEGIVNAPKGTHLLKIEVVDINDMKAIKEQKVVGTTEPTLTIQSKLIDGKATFVIDAEDEDKIATIEILHNGGETQIIEVNEKTYNNQILMTEGEENIIVVRVTNINGLQKTQAAKFNNK